MVRFDPREVAVVTTTYYPKWYGGKLRSIKHAGKVRGDLGLELAREASKQGLHLIIVDAGSTKTFRKELSSVPNVRMLTRKALPTSPCKRLAIRLAAKIPGVKVIIVTEPEKVSLLKDCLEGIVTPLLANQTDIVVPKRTERLFKSNYPAYMYESEIEGNQIYNEALRSNGLLLPEQENFDLFFGPRAFRNEKKNIILFSWKYRLIGESFLTKLYNPEVYSNILFFPIINALRKNMRVMSVEVPFAYPVIQKENEEIGAKEEFVLKRKLQRMSILIDLMHFLSYLEKKKQSRIRVVR